MATKQQAQGEEQSQARNHKNAALAAAVQSPHQWWMIRLLGCHDYTGESSSLGRRLCRLGLGAWDAVLCALSLADA
jgi:hypothetical protein